MPATRSLEPEEPDVELRCLLYKVDNAWGNYVWFHARELETGKGLPLMLLLTGHEPYMYCEPEAPALDHRAVQDVEHGHVSVDGDELVKLTLSHPGRTLTVRDLCENPHEADVPFVLRCVVDSGAWGICTVKATKKKPGVYVTKPKWITQESREVDEDLEALTFDIEGGNPHRIEAAKDEVICIGLKDEVNGNLHLWSYHPINEGMSIEEVDLLTESDAPVNHRHFTDKEDASGERAMLTSFIDWLYERNADVLVTYNGNHYDIPYLIHRARRLGIKDDRWGGHGKLDPVYTNVPGYQCLDLYKVHMKATYGGLKGGNTLEDVLEAFTGIEKTSQAGRVHEFWHEDPEALFRYNLEDVEATSLVDEAQNYGEIAKLAMFTSMATGITDLSNPSSLYFPLMLERGNMRGVAMPPRFGEEDYDMAGGLVFDPETGVHKDAASLDWACYAEGTDVLSEDGWVPLSDVDVGQHVATLNRETNQIEYQAAQQVHEYEYDGKLHRFETARGTCQLVTPNHRVMYQKRTSARDETAWAGEIHEAEAAHIDQFWLAIPWFGDWEGEDPGTIELNGDNHDPENVLRLIGICLGDGTYGGSNISFGVGDEKANRIEEVLDDLDLSYSRNVYEKGGDRDPEHKLTILGEANSDIINLLGGELPPSPERRIPDWCRPLSPECLDALLDGLLITDGSASDWGERECSYYTTSEGLAGDVQEIALKSGTFARVTSETYDVELDGRVYEDHTKYTVYVHTNRKEREKVNVLKPEHRGTEHYEGKVYCLTVPNGTLVTRRRGKPTISGNSQYPSAIKIANLSYETFVPTDEVNGDESWLFEVPDMENAKYLDGPLYFDTREKGILPEIIEDIWDIKREMTRLREQAETEEEYERADIRRDMSKIILNSGFGVASKNKSPLSRIEVGEAITATARHMNRVASKISDKSGRRTLYGDTDSIKIQLKDEDTPEDLERLADRIEEGVCEDLESRGAINLDVLDLDVEHIYGRLLLPSDNVKKKYAYRLDWKEGSWLEEPKVDVTGFWMVRSNCSDYTRAVHEEVFERLLLHDQSIQEVNEWVWGVFCRVRDREEDREAVAKRDKLKQSPRSYYDPAKDRWHWTGLAAVGANQFFDLDEHERWRAGDRPYWYRLKEKPDNYRVKDHQPNYLPLRKGEEVPDGFEIDWAEHARLMVTSKLERIYGIYGAKDLLKRMENTGEGQEESRLSQHGVAYTPSEPEQVTTTDGTSSDGSAQKTVQRSVADFM